MRKLIFALLFLALPMLTKAAPNCTYIEAYGFGFGQEIINPYGTIISQEAHLYFRCIYGPRVYFIGSISVTGTGQQGYFGGHGLPFSCSITYEDFAWGWQRSPTYPGVNRAWIIATDQIVEGNGCGDGNIVYLPGTCVAGKCPAPSGDP